MLLARDDVRAKQRTSGTQFQAQRPFRDALGGETRRLREDRKCWRTVWG